MDGPYNDPIGNPWYLITDGDVTGFVSGWYLSRRSARRGPRPDRDPLEGDDSRCGHRRVRLPARVLGLHAVVRLQSLLVRALGLGGRLQLPQRRRPRGGCYTPLLAADGGTVEYAGWCDCGLGYYVKIDHGNGFKTLYGHMAEVPWVSRGTRSPRRRDRSGRQYRDIDRTARALHRAGERGRPGSAGLPSVVLSYRSQERAGSVTPPLSCCSGQRLRLMRYDGQAFQHAMDVRGNPTAPVVAGDGRFTMHVPGSHRSIRFRVSETVMDAGIEIHGPVDSELEAILSPEAVAFVAALHRRFNPRRQELLRAREERQTAIDAGAELEFLPETRAVRDATWQVAPGPGDLLDRRVEITGPCDRKMVINALNSGAKVFMADLEDASSPTWSNVVDGQKNLYDAVRRTISFQNPDGREYALNPDTATLLVRPRGWHLDERHMTVDGEPVSGSLFDFGLYFFHNAQELIDRGSGPTSICPSCKPPRGATLERRLHLCPGRPRHSPRHGAGDGADRDPARRLRDG